VTNLGKGIEILCGSSSICSSAGFMSGVTEQREQEEKEVDYCNVTAATDD
jgi:hypothetical protein